MNDIERFERLYGAAGRRLRTLCLTLDLSTYTDTKAMEVRHETADLVRTLNVAVDRWASEAIPRAYAKGERVARTSLEILGKKPRKPQNVDTVRMIIDDLMVLLIRANNSINDTVADYAAVTGYAARAVERAQLQEFSFGEVAEKVARLIASAQFGGKARWWVFRVIRAHLLKILTQGNFIKINGRYYNLRKYARLVARTEMRKADTAAVLDMANQYDADLVKWSSHNTECDAKDPVKNCHTYEGKTYSISGRTYNIPGLVIEKLTAIPPIHPYCMHSLRVTSEEAIEVTQRRGETDLARKLREARERGETMYEYAQRVIKEKNLWELPK